LIKTAAYILLILEIFGLFLLQTPVPFIVTAVGGILFLAMSWKRIKSFETKKDTIETMDVEEISDYFKHPDAYDDLFVTFYICGKDDLDFYPIVPSDIRYDSELKRLIIGNDSMLDRSSFGLSSKDDEAMELSEFLHLINMKRRQAY
jgi:hypothetical protein